MMKFLVVLMNTTDYVLDGALFVSNIRMRWPDAKIRNVEDPGDPYVIEWVLSIGYDVDCALHRSGEAISLEGSLDDCAVAAIWIRSLIPSQYKLVFFDQGYHASIDLLDNTTSDQIVGAFISS
jgi:hypothetical protein